MTSTSALITSTSVTGGIHTIALAGDLDVATAPELAPAVAVALGSERCRQIRLNLSGVEFCDSSGLGALVVARNTTLERQVELVLEKPSTAVARVLELSGTNQVFTVD